MAGPVQALLVDGLGHATRLRLDGSGRPLERLAPDGGLETWARDAGGFVTAYTDALERTVTFTRNSQGSVTQETYPGPVTRSYTYGSQYQQPLTATDENGHTTTYAYYSNNLHLQTATDPLNQVTTYTWTSAGLLQSVTDPRGVTTSYGYDTPS